MSKPWEQQWNDIPSGGRPDEPKETGIVPWLKSWVSSDTPKRATNDTGIQPINRKFDEVFEKLIQAESRGRHMDESGKLTTSPVGAQGITQLMPATAKKPGYGIEPVKDTSEAEYKRVGKEYLQALVGEFGGDYEKAVAAYNAGAKNVKRAVEKGGDNWKEHLPKKSETLPYLQRVLGDGAQFQGEAKSLVQAQDEKLPKFTLADVAKKGLLSEEGRGKFLERMKNEWREGMKGKTDKELDKYYSVPYFYMKAKYPEEFQMYSVMSGFGGTDLSERQIAAIGLDTPISKSGATEGSTMGYVYNTNPDRVFLTGISEKGTLVHEREHLTSQRSNENNRTIGQVGRLHEPFPRMVQDFVLKDRKWFDKNPVMQQVFHAGNALNSDNEVLSNIAEYESTLPIGTSLYQSEFAKELEKKYGKERTKEFLDQTVALTFNDKGRIAESDFEFDTNKLDKDASYAKQVYQYLKQKFGD